MKHISSAGGKPELHFSMAAGCFKNLQEDECRREELVISKPVQDSGEMCQGGKLKEAPGQHRQVDDNG